MSIRVLLSSSLRAAGCPRPRPALCGDPWRALSSTPRPPDPAISPATDEEGCDHEEILKEVHLTDDGKVLFESLHDMHLPQTDSNPAQTRWADFEQTFGLDRLHRIDFDDWHPRSSWTVDDYDPNNSDQLRHMADILHSHHHKTPPSQSTAPPVGSDHDLHDPLALQSIQQLERIVSDALNQSPSQSTSNLHSLASSTHHPQVPFDTPIDTHLKPSRRPVHRRAPQDGSTTKIDRFRHASRKAARPSKKPSPQASVNVSQPSQSPDLCVSSFEQALQLPENARKPGYEIRIRRLEAQMDRITTQLLCLPGNDFHDSGATLHHILLSPDGFSLSVFYVPFHSHKPSPKWSRRVASQVRSALANQLHAKRVPKVHLMSLSPQRQFVDEGLPSTRQRHLDDLFDNIASERERIDNALRTTS